MYKHTPSFSSNDFNLSIKAVIDYFLNNLPNNPPTPFKILAFEEEDPEPPDTAEIISAMLNPSLPDETAAINLSTTVGNIAVIVLVTADDNPNFGATLEENI